MNIRTDYIPKSKWTRPGTMRTRTLGIVVHWLAAPGQNPDQCRRYFAERSGDYGSAHDIIGLDGQILEVIPHLEIAYHCGSSTLDPKSGRIYTDLARRAFGALAVVPQENPKLATTSPNVATIGIECCHPDWTGRFTDATLEALEARILYYLDKYGLTPDQVFTHHDVVGWKDCPRWFTNHPDKWDSFKEILRNA